MGLLRWLLGRQPRRLASADWEQVEREERIRKLRAETAILELQASPRGQRYERFKTIAGIGALITGLAAIAGIAVSAYQYLKAEKSIREIRVEERLDRALALLGSEVPATRLAGVVSLTSFLSASNQRQANQTLLALTRAIGLEPSAAVRGAIVSSLVDANLSREQRDMALRTLVHVSRTLVSEGELATGWSVYDAAPPPESAEARAISVATVMTALLRRGGRAQDMSGVYLADADLHGLILNSVSFRSAILSGVNFAGASLQGSSFEDANLESVSFHFAKLTHANFRHADPYHSNLKKAYVASQIGRIVKTYLAKEIDTDAFELHGPDFKCADLTGSDFTRHPLYVWAKLPNDVTFLLDTSFQWAELRDATFASLTVIGLVAKRGSVESSDGPPFPTSSETMSEVGGGYTIIDSIMGVPGDEVSGPNLHLTDIEKSLDWEDSPIHLSAQRSLREAFLGSNWTSARIPRILSATLSASAPDISQVSPCNDPKTH